MADRNRSPDVYLNALITRKETSLNTLARLGKASAALGALVLLVHGAAAAQSSAPLTQMRVLASPVDDVMPVL